MPISGSRLHILHRTSGPSVCRCHRGEKLSCFFLDEDSLAQFIYCLIVSTSRPAPSPSDREIGGRSHRSPPAAEHFIVDASHALGLSPRPLGIPGGGCWRARRLELSRTRVESVEIVEAGDGFVHLAHGKRTNRLEEYINLPRSRLRRRVFEGFSRSGHADHEPWDASRRCDDLGSMAWSAAAIRLAATSSSCSSSGVKPSPQGLHRPAVERIAAPREETHPVLHAKRRRPECHPPRRRHDVDRRAEVPPERLDQCVPPAPMDPPHPSHMPDQVAALEQLGHAAHSCAWFDVPGHATSQTFSLHVLGEDD